MELEALPLPVVLLAAQPPFAILHGNQRFRERFDPVGEPLQSLTAWLETTYPTDDYRRRILDHWLQAAKQALDCGQASLQCRLASGNGEPLEVLFQLGVQDGTLLAVLIDVTARMRSEAALEEARSLEAEAALAITEAIPVGTYTMVMPPERPVAYFAFMSERFLALTGLDRNRARENPLEGFACVHPDDYEEWLRLNAEAFAARRPFKGETRVVVNGETRWCSAESVPRQLADGATVWEGVLIDVTDRVLAQKELQESEANLRRILDNLPIPVATLELRDGQEITFQNQRFLETFHYTHDQIGNLEAWMRLAYPDADYRAEVEQRWSRALSAADDRGGRVAGEEYRVHGGDGHDRDVLISGTRLDNLLVVTLVDISERKEHERQLAAARQREKQLELEQRRRLEQKLRTSLTAAAVAHEINQPLSAILLSCKLAEQRLTPSEAAGNAVAEGMAGFLSQLIQDVDRVVRIIETMRSLLRNVQTEHQPVSLSQVLDSCLLYLKQPLEAGGVQVRCQGLAEPCWLAGDADQLQVAVSNLLRNALEALRGREGPAIVAIHLQQLGNTLELSIEDNGPGLPDGLVEALPLTSTKVDGSGLGLFVVQTTVDNHGGSLRFGRSRLGGAAVRLHFPALPQPG